MYYKLFWLIMMISYFSFLLWIKKTPYLNIFYTEFFSPVYLSFMMYAWSMELLESFWCLHNRKKKCTFSRNTLKITEISKVYSRLDKIVFQGFITFATRIEYLLCTKQLLQGVKLQRWDNIVHAWETPRLRRQVSQQKSSNTVWWLPS